MSDNNNTFTHPAPRIEARWFLTFAQQLTQTQTLAVYDGRCDLLLLGDSITEACAWVSEFQNRLPGLKILYYGIGGDQTQHLLWRMENGLLDGIAPRFTSLLIGVNNIWTDPPVDALADGAIACGRFVRRKLPQTKLLHLGIFPLREALAHLDGKVRQVNERIEAAAGGYGARYLDLRHLFLEPDGSDMPGMLAADGVHLTMKAYDRWGAAMAEAIK